MVIAGGAPEEEGYLDFHPAAARGSESSGSSGWMPRFGNDVIPKLRKITRFQVSVTRQRKASAELTPMLFHHPSAYLSPCF